MSYPQSERQRVRKAGKYAPMNKCEVCGAALGSNYLSHPEANVTSAGGLVLCYKVSCWDEMNRRINATGELKNE